jgi:hypothetical protein
MSIGGAAPERLRPLVQPREYWNVWAKTAPVKQHRTRRTPENIGDRHRQEETVLWKSIFAAATVGLKIKYNIHIINNSNILL